MEKMRNKRTNGGINKYRELAISIIEEFEEMLDAMDISLPSKDREGNPEEARIYGTEYYLLEDTITDLLKKHIRKWKRKNEQKRKMHKV